MDQEFLTVGGNIRAGDFVGSELGAAGEHHFFNPAVQLTFTPGAASCLEHSELAYLYLYIRNGPRIEASQIALQLLQCVHIEVNHMARRIIGEFNIAP